MRESYQQVSFYLLGDHGNDDVGDLIFSNDISYDADDEITASESEISLLPFETSSEHSSADSEGSFELSSTISEPGEYFPSCSSGYDESGWTSNDER